MKNFKPINQGHAKLFNSPVAECFTRSSPVLSWLTYTSIITALLLYSVKHAGYHELTALVLFFSGLKFWTLFEYLIHRFVFHWISSNPRIERLTYILHGNHHHYPKDRRRLFMPLLPGLMISGTLLGIMFLVAGNYAFMFFPGFIFGHLVQSTLHYAIHSGPATFTWLKPLWRSHQLHHYTNEEKGFGLTSTFWDYIFHTNFKAKETKEDPEKVKAIMFDK